MSIPNDYLDLFAKKSFGHLATLMPDGSPQVTPVWVDYDGTYLLVNSAEGRQKDRNMERDKRVAISIQDPDDPYRYLQVRGRVAEITTEGADDHIDKQAQHYFGLEEYPYRAPGEVRKLYKIKPE
jgi:PPOX class probable F420-dependent enzyme